MPISKGPVHVMVRGDHTVKTSVPAEVTRLKARGYREADGGIKAEAAEPDVSDGSDKSETPKPDVDKPSEKTSDAKPEKAKANEPKPPEAKAAKQ